MYPIPDGDRMSESGNHEFILPTRLARRRLMAGRLAVSIFIFNLAFSLIGAWALSGPAAGLTRFDFGFAGWALALFAGSLLLAVPVAGLLIMKLLQPPPE